MVRDMETSLAAAKNGTARRGAAFDAMTAFTRGFTRRRFLSPPLAAATSVSRGRAPRGAGSTASGTPMARIGRKDYCFLSRSARLTARLTRCSTELMGETVRSETAKPSGVIQSARHEPGSRIVYGTGVPGDPDSKGCRIRYSVASHGEISASNSGDPRCPFFAKRKKDDSERRYGGNGKTAYFAVRIENGGKKSAERAPVPVLTP
jgi:hypothetical protein